MPGLLPAYLEGAADLNKLYNLKYTLEQMHIFTSEDVEEFVQLFVVKIITAENLQPFFQRLVTTGYARQSPEDKEQLRKEVARYVK